MNLVFRSLKGAEQPLAGSQYGLRSNDDSPGYGLYITCVPVSLGVC
jgi:hypothetical protein